MHYSAIAIVVGYWFEQLTNTKSEFLMKFLFYCFLLLFSACTSSTEPQKLQATQKRQALPMGTRKSAIAERLLFDIYTLHFDINTPLNHPTKIEEYIIQGWRGQRNDTIKREYYYENNRLSKVFDNEFRSNSTYIFKYDGNGRRILIDQQTPKGSFHKDTFEYYPNEPFQAVREHFMFNKSEDRLRFNYHGNSDTIEVDTYDGADMYYFRESSDTLFVEKVWQDRRGIVLSNKIDIYDKNNRLAEVQILEQGRIDRIISYKYDNRGNQVARVEIDADNVIGGSAGITAVSAPQSYRSVYEYDNRGNWIKKTEQNGNGKYKAVTQRKITYAP